jgi:hypothetical protein
MRATSIATGVLAVASLLVGATSTQAVERQLGPSSRRTPLAITEIHYHPAPWAGTGNQEFVELHNTEPVAFDLSGFRLRGDADYTFPTGAVLPGLAFAVIASDPTALATRYGITNAYGPWTGALPNSGGRVRIENRWGAELLAVEFNDTPPWPTAADGAGHSMVLLAPDLGEANPLAWAASSAFTGSPGAVDPPRPDVYGDPRLNELYTHANPTQAFIEVYNAGTQSLDLAGYVLCDDPDSTRHVIAGPSILPPGGFLVRSESQLGFSVNPAGDDLFLLAPDQLTVLDAIRVTGRDPGTPLGRYPDGNDDLTPLASASPGAANTNATIAIPNIVINEIMYRPMNEPVRGEYVELHNRSAAPVALAGWRFTAGIDFAFPPSATIPAGGFLVVARDADHLTSRHIHLGPANTLGNFSGSLSDRGERLTLARPLVPGVTNGDSVVVDEVTYADDNEWGAWTDGGGSSLELTDPRADNRLAANWAGSDESRKALWTTIEHTGVLEDGSGTMDELNVYLHQSGEALVDNISFTRQNETLNRVAPATFDTTLDGWTAIGTHLRSTRVSTEGDGSSGSLHLRASDGGRSTTSSYALGDYDRIWKPVSPAPLANQTFTVRARGRWLAGWPFLSINLKGFWIEAAGRLHVPENLGTPGLVNSRYATNAPPAIWDLQHAPLLPAAGQDVTVRCHAHDPDGLAALTLYYRLDPSAAYTSVVMQAQSTGGNGHYQAVIPGQAANAVVGFYVLARDLSIPARERAEPSAELIRNAIVRFGDARPSSVFGRYHYWVSEANRAALASRSNQSNEPVDTTLIYDGCRAIYNAELRYRGNFRLFASLTDAAYAIDYPRGPGLLGDRETKIDIPSIQFSNGTRQQERHAFWLAEQVGHPANNLRFARVHVNGSDLLRHDFQPPTRDFAQSWYGDGDAEIYKEEKPLDPFGVYETAGGDKHRSTYAYIMQKNRTAVPDYEYGALYRLVDALNHPDMAVRDARVAALADARGLAGYFAGNHVAGNEDSYGYGLGFLHNMYAYLPKSARAWLHLHDMDSAFTTSLTNGIADLFPSSQAPASQRLFRDPPFERIYWRVLQDFANGPMTASASDARLDTWYAAFTNDGLTVASPDVGVATNGVSKTMKQWIADRRAQILGALATTNANVAVSITSNGGADFTETNRLVTLTGLAPIAAESLWVNGLKARPTWTSTLHWQLRLALAPGANPFMIEARTPSGATLGTDSITVTGTAAALSPVGLVAISEIMPNPPQPRSEFIELFNLSHTEPFELGGWRIDAVDHTFARGVVIPPRGRIVVAEDTPAYAATYGNAEVLAGDYAGNLADEGELVRLLAPTGDGGEIVVDELAYAATPPWPAAANGQGASLQVIDLAQDNRLPGNWRAVDPLANATWRFVSITGTATNNDRTISAAEVRLMLESPGSMHVDRIALVTGTVAEAGLNRLTNGDFESAFTAPWSAVGNHARSTANTMAASSGIASLLLNATDRSGGASHCVRQAALGLVTSQTYTLSYWFLPTTSVSGLTVEVSASDIRIAHAVTPAPPAQALATPGVTNSTAAVLPTLPPIWINEVLPANPGPVVDNHGEPEPWIELWNADTGIVSLAGLHLARSHTALTEWALPPTLTMNPGEYRLIWADGETNETTPSALHAGFRLAPTSGVLVLSCLAGTNPIVLDALAYDSLAAGASVGATSPGDPLRRSVFPSPTPGANNALSIPLLPLRINEWQADNTRIPDPADNRSQDWFELFNPNAMDIGLAGYRLTDDLANLNQVVVPAGIVVPGHGFLLVWADGEPAQTTPPHSLHVDFKLNNDGDLIRLGTADGSLVDIVSFGAQGKNRAEGRWADGEDGTFRMLLATPGASNQVLRVQTTALLTNQLFRVQWAAASGIHYTVESAPELVATNWGLLGSLTANTAQAFFDAPTPPGPTQHFYRIRDISP